MKIRVKEISSVPLQQALRHLDKAFSNFFNRLTKYPKFKNKHRRQSASFMANSFTYREGVIQLAKQKEPLEIKWSRKFSGTPTSLTVTKDSVERYFVSIVVKETVAELPFVKKELGLDLGLENMIIDHEGNRVSNPRFMKKDKQKLRRKQKALSRKKLGSKNREKQRKKVAKHHARIRDKRNDFLHQLTTKIVHENQVIAVESLNVKGMMKNSRLSGSIADVGWGEFIRILEYKCGWYGRELVKVDRFYPSSKRCSGCGNTREQLPLEIRKWHCASCGRENDRDQNAARNILEEGLRIRRCTVGLTGKEACGAGVRPEDRCLMAAGNEAGSLGCET